MNFGTSLLPSIDFAIVGAAILAAIVFASVVFSAEILYFAGYVLIRKRKPARRLFADDGKEGECPL